MTVAAKIRKKISTPTGRCTIYEDEERGILVHNDIWFAKASNYIL